MTIWYADQLKQLRNIWTDQKPIPLLKLKSFEELAIEKWGHSAAEYLDRRAIEIADKIAKKDAEIKNERIQKSKTFSTSKYMGPRDPVASHQGSKRRRNF